MGGDMTARTEEGRVPLALAVPRGHVEVATLLLKRKADVQARDDLKQTPLHLGSAAGEGQATALVIRYMGRVDQEDSAGQLPMDLALLAKKDCAVRALIKGGAVLPKAVADKPEMQPLIREVEKELVEEALDEVQNPMPSPRRKWR